MGMLAWAALTGAASGTLGHWAVRRVLGGWPGAPSSPAVAVILGSAFSTRVSGEGLTLGGHALERVTVPTPWGCVDVMQLAPSALCGGRRGYVIARHGVPHRSLPHEIPYRAIASALRLLGCRALLVTSSVGLLSPTVPKDTLLPVMDLLMPENRLPCGGPCTVFAPATVSGAWAELGAAPAWTAGAVPTDVVGEPGHLVLGGRGGLFHPALTAFAREAARLAQGAPPSSAAAEGGRRPEPAGGEGGVVFAYVPGPRTKTPAENAAWRLAGADVNSMTLGPEVVLAAELGVPTAAVVVGHKRSGKGGGLRPEGDTGARVEGDTEARVEGGGGATGTPVGERTGQSRQAARHGEAGTMERSLVDGRAALERLALTWLQSAPVEEECRSWVYRLDK